VEGAEADLDGGRQRGRRADPDQGEDGDLDGVAYEAVVPRSGHRNAGIKKQPRQADEESNVCPNDRHMAPEAVIGSDRRGVDSGTNASDAAVIVVA
jgi:hypothetical protein